MATQTEDIAEIKCNVSKILDILNGPTGLVTSMELSKVDRKSLRAELKVLNDKYNAWSRIVSGAVLFLLGSDALFAWALITHQAAIVFTK